MEPGGRLVSVWNLAQGPVVGETLFICMVLWDDGPGERPLRRLFHPYHRTLRISLFVGSLDGRMDMIYRCL